MYTPTCWNSYRDLKPLLALLIAALCLPLKAQVEGSNPVGVSGPSERGDSFDATLFDITGLQISSRMDLQFQVNVTPQFPTSPGLSIQGGTRYNSNILSWYQGVYYDTAHSNYQNRDIAYIPTLKSPYGVGFEAGNPVGVIYQQYHNSNIGPTTTSSYKRSWYFQDSSGSVHVLFSAQDSQSGVNPPPPPDTAGMLGGHLLFGNSFLKQQGDGNWKEDYGVYQGPGVSPWEYYTNDHCCPRQPTGLIWGECYGLVA